MNGVLAGGDVIALLRSFRIVRCLVCGGADCTGALGWLCNSQRPGLALAPEPEAAAESWTREEPGQQRLFGLPEVLS